MFLRLVISCHTLGMPKRSSIRQSRLQPRAGQHQRIVSRVSHTCGAVCLIVGLVATKSKLPAPNPNPAASYGTAQTDLNPPTHCRTSPAVRRLPIIHYSLFILVSVIAAYVNI